MAVNVKFQQISRVVGRSSRGSGCGPLKAECREVEVVNKGVDETDGILFGNVVIEPLREQERFVAVRAVEKTPAGTKLPKSKKVSRDSEQCDSLPKYCVLTQSGTGADALQLTLVPRVRFRARLKRSVRRSNPSTGSGIRAGLRSRVYTWRGGDTWEHCVIHYVQRRRCVPRFE
jgi:hypothetical protein